MKMGVIGMLMELLKLRNFIIFSLILQSLLLLSPLRKKIAAPAAITSLWVLYTLTTLAADCAVGLATTASINPPTQPPPPLISLWSQFIFLHVVGPDTITAFSFDDTNPWFRTSFRLFVTSVAANRATIVLFPKSRLVVAAVFICFAGTIKIYDTARCFFMGNLTRFRTFTKPVLDADVHVRLAHVRLRDVDVARDAFGFCQTYKGVFANVVFSPQQCSRSREYFLSVSAEDAFAVVETKLNFMYEVLYTKKLALTWWFWRVFRLVIVLFEFAAFFVWVSADKSGFDEVDVRITYTLFLCAMVFEVIFFLIHLLSNWTIASFLLQRSSEEESFWVTLMHKFISFKNKFGFLSRRWSGSVSRYNLIMCCTSKSSPKVEKVFGWLKIKDLVYGFRNMSPTSFDKRLRDLFFNELKYRSLKAEQLRVAMDMSSSRGDWILRDYYDGNASVLRFANTWFVESMEFYNIILLWHVATELCYNVYASDNDDHEEKEWREYSKVISDYMAYLLIREETMLSEVAGEAKATFQHACDEVVKMLIVGEMEGLKAKEEKVERACRMIMANRDEVEAGDEGIDGKKKSVLEDARNLSKELKGMADGGIKMWEVTSKVWVELLCYAACSCKESEHAAQLCKGGQLFTIVWLLMAHMGLSNRFEHPK